MLLPFLFIWKRAHVLNVGSDFQFAVYILNSGDGSVKRMVHLHSAEKPKPQEIEIGSTEHDPFLKLQAVDLCFNLAVTPHARKRRFDRCIIFADATRHFLNSGRPLFSA